MRATGPADVIADVLMASRRRCCVCFGLSADTAQKRGQIAHIDRDAPSPARDNLVFLCLHHHDVYDSQTSQSKGIMVEVVKGY
ncbi:MAG: hypothetical protein U0821_19100 [Chloroflexota bacterium]